MRTVLTVHFCYKYQADSGTCLTAYVMCAADWKYTSIFRLVDI
jgi:hypothetical protein